MRRRCPPCVPPSTRSWRWTRRTSSRTAPSASPSPRPCGTPRRDASASNAPPTAARDAGSLQLLDTALWIMSLAELSGGTPRRAHEYIEQVRELRRAIGYDAEHVINVALLAWSDAPRPQVEMISDGAASMGFGGVAAAGQAALAVRDLAEGQLRGGLPSAQAAGRRSLPPGHPAGAARLRRGGVPEPARRRGRPARGVPRGDGVRQRIECGPVGSPSAPGRSSRHDAEPHHRAAHHDPRLHRPRHRAGPRTPPVRRVATARPTTPGRPRAPAPGPRALRARAGSGVRPPRPHRAARDRRPLRVLRRRRTPWTSPSSS